MKIFINVKYDELETNNILQQIVDSKLIKGVIISFTNGMKKEFLEKTIKLYKEKVSIYFEIENQKQLELLSKYNIDGVKIKYPDILNVKLLKDLEFFLGNIILSIYGASIIDIRYTLDIMEKYKNKQNLTFVYGNEEIQDEENNLFKSVDISKLENMNKNFGQYNTGLSINLKNYKNISSILYSFFAYDKITHSFLELHYNESILVYLEEVFNSIEESKLIFNDNKLKLLSNEINYRTSKSKHWIVNRKLNKNERIEFDDLEFEDIESGLPSLHYDDIHNKKLVKDIEKGELITNEYFENKVLAIITARSDSTRLPNKAVKDICGKPALSHLLERLKRSLDAGYIDTIAFCTTMKQSDDKLVDIAKEFPVKIYRGSEHDVLGRMVLAVDDNLDHNITLRITGDDILIDPFYLNETVTYHLKTNADYTDAKKIPSGVEVEVFNSKELKLISELSEDRSGSEYVTNYILDNQDYFNVSHLPVPAKHDNRLRLTLDTQDDYDVIRTLLEYMKEIGKEYTYDVDDIFDYYHKYKDTVFKINSKIVQKVAPPSINTNMDWRGLSKQPLVTVYITNYNYSTYIKQSVDSVLNQKFRDFEIIIIDDGSTDDSKSIIEKYKNNPKVRIVYQQNKGLNVTNNIALNMSYGKYLMRLDADDYLDENALLLMVDKLKDEKIALVFPDYYTVDKSGEILEQIKRHDFEKEVSLFDQPAHGACTMIRKDVLHEVNGYCEDFSCQDGYELWVKVFNKYKVANINLPLFFYRQHGENLTSNDSRILSTRHQIIKKHVDIDDIKAKNHICIIPIRGELINQIPVAIHPFSNTNLLEVVLKQVSESQYYKKIIVTTPNEEIINFLDQQSYENIIINKRPEELSGINTYLEDTIDYLEETYKDAFENLDTLSLVNYEYPLRSGFYFDKAINTLYLYDVDSIISVKEKTSNFYIHSGKGLKPIIENKVLRLEREIIYEEVGGIHTFKFDSYKKFRTINMGKIGHIVMDEKSVQKVGSIFDFKAKEAIYKDNNESFQK